MQVNSGTNKVTNVQFFSANGINVNFYAISAFLTKLVSIITVLKELKHCMQNANAVVPDRLQSYPDVLKRIEYTSDTETFSCNGAFS